MPVTRCFGHGALDTVLLHWQLLQWKQGCEALSIIIPHCSHRISVTASSLLLLCWLFCLASAKEMPHNNAYNGQPTADDSEYDGATPPIVKTWSNFEKPLLEELCLPRGGTRGLLSAGCAVCELLGMELSLGDILPTELQHPVLSLHGPHSSFLICPSSFSLPAPPIPVFPIFLPIWDSPTLPF